MKDRYPGHEIQNLAVLTARTHGPRLLGFVHQNREGALSFSFPVVNLGQWRARGAELEALSISNPFAVVVMAQIEGEHDVAFVTSIERMAEKRGRQEGRQEGELASASRILRGLLQHKFGPVPDWADARIAQADETLLHHWTLRILDAETVEAVFAA